MNICKLDGCLKEAKKGTVCSMHRARKERHGNYSYTSFDGRSKHPMYRRWNAMVERCTKEYSSAWKNYGGRGIRVCDRWLGRKGFDNFIEDVGMPPSKEYTLDRIDNDKGYSPDNVRWALKDIQAHNQRARSVSGHMGVYRFRGKWRCSVSRGNNNLYGGTFTSKKQAILKYKKLERQLYGS